MVTITTVSGRSYTPEDIVKAIQKHIDSTGDLMGNITHVFRVCRQWQEKHKGAKHVMKGPELDYEEYEGGTLPDCAMKYFMEVVEPALRAQPPAQVAE